MKNLRLWMASLAGLAMLAGIQPARADVTADALLKVLVRKGILTQDEANDVKAEATKEAAAPKPAAATPAKGTVISGFLQVRSTSQRYANPSTQFSDRRARVIVKNTSDKGKAVVSIEAAPVNAGVRDGYYDMYLTPTVQHVPGYTLRLGQFFKPFGSETDRSEQETEFPEKPAGIVALFPGFRDIGATLTKGLDATTVADLGIYNGNGAGLASLPGKDNDNYKDLLLRVRRTVPEVGDFTLTAYKGRNTIAATSTTAEYTGDRNRLGLAAVMPNLVGGTLRSEYIAARDLTTNLGDGAKWANANERVWFAQYVHPVASKTSVGVRYDEYDPDIHNRLRLDGDGEVRTVGIVGVHNLSDQIKLSLAIERPRATHYNTTSKTADTRNENVLTFQGQYRF